MGKAKRKSSPSPKQKNLQETTPKKKNVTAKSPKSGGSSSSGKKDPKKGLPKKDVLAVALDPADVQPVVSSDSEQEPQQTTVVAKENAVTSSITKYNPTDKIVETDKDEEELDSTSSTGYSRLFAPYRSLGIVSHKGPFHLLHHQNSGSAMACVAIGERFHLLQCDKLQPVLVSQAVPAGSSSSHKIKKKNKKGLHEISHLISDSSLSLSMVAHGLPQQSRHVSLYQRTRPIATLNVVPPPQPSSSSSTTATTKKEWKIVDMLHLGLIQVTIETPGEKQGTKENALLCAVILSASSSLSEKQDEKDDQGDSVPIVGDDDSDSDDSSQSDTSSSESSSDSDSDDEESSSSKKDCCGQVVMIVATRTTLRLHKRILLSNVPSFVPRVAIHPSTYVNKILLGGSSRSSNNNNNKQQDALLLVNIKTGKMIHNFTCIPATTTTSASKGGKLISSEVTTLEQSPAVDTIAVGTSQGMVHLVNTRHDRLLFSLCHKARNDKKQNSSSSTKNVRITSIAFRTDGAALQYEIAPMAVGRSDGNITIWDLTPPKQEDSDDDDEDGVAPPPPPMGRTILTEMEKVHYPGGVAKLEYFPGEPLLLSTGTHSNSVLMHIFDNPDHSGRILRQRKGHTSPPQNVRYLHPGAGAGGGILVNAADGTDARACQILSSGGSDRTLRLFSTARTVLDKEYSQGKGLEKRAKQLGMDSKAELLLPRLTAMVTSEARSRDWGDLVTIHEDHAFAYVWSSKRGAQSGPVLRQGDWNVSAMKVPPPITAHATSLAISTCGNYALVGTKGGTIYRYNVQSGNPRGSYPPPEKNTNTSSQGNRHVAGDINRTVKALEKKMKISNRASNLDQQAIDVVEQAKIEQLRNAKLELASHAGFAVTGVAVDAVNKTVISVGADAKLILWNFKTHAPHKKSPIRLPAPASKLCHVRDSDLAAIALEDYSVLLFDCSTLTTVRRFGVGSGDTSLSVCHTGPISDLGFSPDGRTLYTSSLDGTIRVWDVPTNTCVDWLGFKTPPTSLTVSPTGEFLSTTHTGRLGISLWSDRSFYQTVHVDGAQALTSPARMDDPVPIAETSGGGDNDQDQTERLRRAVSALASAKGSGKTEKEEEAANKGPATAKEDGLITLSGLPPAHWKNLFHLELVKQRNKPKEAPKKPPTAPFFLQWRGSEPLGGEPVKNAPSNQDKELPSKDEEDVWNAVWSDDDDGGGNGGVPGNPPLNTTIATKRAREENEQDNSNASNLKIRKVTHYRSRLASLLEECAAQNEPGAPNRFQAITDHIGTLGPSAIDVSLSSLCSGMHDIEEGLPLLHLACLWLLEACQSRERYEAVNAYLHRFLYLHATVIAGIDDSSLFHKKSNDNEEEDVDMTEEEKDEKQSQSRQREELLVSIAALRKAQQAASGALENKLQHTLCLLRHFSRMV